MNNLTICIPTYNRKDFLAYTLAKTLGDFPGVNIIVSDNCSTETPHTIPQPQLPASLRYIRQSTNIGAFPNMRAALLAANTKYCVFCGDDDYLLPEEVARGVAYLEENKDVVAYFAPCQLYDEVKGEPAWDAFYLADDTVYGDRPDGIWNFIIDNHVWPEHAIYRRKGLEDIMQPRIKPYWCFVDLGNAFAKGKIFFGKTPYYRNITQHPIGYRHKLGDQQCLTDFEEYRSGLEVLAFDLFQGYLHDKVLPERRVALRTQINIGIRQFIYKRLEVARRILLAQNRAAEATVLEKRMVITGF